MFHWINEPLRYTVVQVSITLDQFIIDWIQLSRHSASIDNNIVGFRAVSILAGWFVNSCQCCVIFVSFLCHFRVIFVSDSFHFRVIFVLFFVSFLCHFCMRFKSYSCHFCVIFCHFLIILMSDSWRFLSIVCHFRVILCHSRVIFISFSYQLFVRFMSFLCHFVSDLCHFRVIFRYFCVILCQIQVIFVTLLRCTLSSSEIVLSLNYSIAISWI